MGLSPASVPPTVIAPVSPSELLRARDEYLNARKARLNAPAQSQDPGTPVVGLEPLPSATGPLGGPSNNPLAPKVPGGFSPSSYTGAEANNISPTLWNADTHPLQPLLDSAYVVASSQLKSKAPVVIKVAAPPKAVAPKTAPLAARGGSIRGGSPRDRAMLNRSGSPRDRIGQGVATQALSYRGMPYIRGAASPRRGFDCSGLVYFLLRQRGYNPPRTAAGYRNWGQSVPKGQLKPGDLVLFANTYKRGISHIGVYYGEGKFVHAATSGTGVRVSSLNERYYAGKYYGARRIK
jgi:cell wall-associated NlpC family hydrolase